MSGLSQAAVARGPAAHGREDFPEIGRLLAAIQTWNVASEAVYLGVGENIHALHRKVSTVRDAIRRSTDVFGTAATTEMRDGLSTAAETTRRLAMLTAERAEALTRLRVAVDTAGSGSTAVLLVFRLLDYVVLIARAQVSGMSDGQDELGPFTAHVDDLVTVGEEVANGIDGRMKMLHQCLETSRLIETRASRSGGGAMIEDFMALAARVTEQQETLAEARDAAQAAFTEIWKAIGGVVTGLQFHDMARQRLEHTIVNLNRMQDVLVTGLVTEGGAPIDTDLRPVAVRRIAILETAQLDDLSRLYEAKMAELDGHLARVGAEMEESDAVLARLAGGSNGVSSLDAEAAELGAHFRQGAETRLSLGASLDQCIEATDTLLKMTGRLDDLEHELKLAGINAAVRAAHVQGGDETIGYIARVICEQASIARCEADKVREGIERAVHETRELAGRILPDIETAEAAIEGCLKDAAAALTTAETAYAAELGIAAYESRTLGTDVAAVRDRMTPHVEGCRLMGALSAALSTIAADLVDAEAGADCMAELDAELAGHYTMAEERAIFAAVIGIGIAPALPHPDQPPAPAPGSCEDLDDILF